MGMGGPLLQHRALAAFCPAGSHPLISSAQHAWALNTRDPASAGGAVQSSRHMLSLAQSVNGTPIFNHATKGTEKPCTAAAGWPNSRLPTEASQLAQQPPSNHRPALASRRLPIASLSAAKISLQMLHPSHQDEMHHSGTTETVESQPPRTSRRCPSLPLHTSART